MQSTKQAVFMLGEEAYSFDIMDIKTLEKVIPIESAEGLSKNFKGVIRLRGDLIPVYSLRRKFGLEDTETDQDTRFIVTISRGVQVAYEVDRMKEIVDMDASQLYDSPEILRTESTSYVKGIAKIEDHPVIILDDDGILTEEETTEIKTLLNQ